MSKRKKINIKKKENDLYINNVKLDDFQVEELRKFTFSNLFNGVNEDDFLVFNKSTKSFKINSKTVGLSELKKIKEHTKFINSSSVFKLILNEMKSIAYLKMFENSQTEKDLLAGKMMLYNIEVLRKKIFNLSEIEIPKNIEEVHDD